MARLAFYGRSRGRFLRPPAAEPAGRPLAKVLLLLTCLAAARAVADQRIIGKRETVFESAEPRMHMPTSVAVDAAGNVYVSDGANDRIVVFDSSGKPVSTITTIGAERLSRPMGIRVDAAGHLWIADSGNHRVLVRKPDGSLDRTIAGPVAGDAERADITDVSPSGDGSIVWLVDNDHHVLHRFDAGADQWRTIGGRGEGPGQFHYPFAISHASDGRLLVTDTINARVVVLGPDGTVSGAIGRFGVSAGELCRPKDAVARSDGSVWVSDSTLGVVQVFDREGAFIGLLRDEGGEPLRLEHPVGLAFDAGGSLYVVEQMEHRVQKLRVEIAGERAPADKAPERSPATAPQQPRECLACHIDWMPGFRDESSLMARFESAPDSPVASREEVCLACHDGSVVDSRESVWRDHGHRSGTKLPSHLAAPGELPVRDGALTCRTCHSAHERPVSGNLFHDAIWLRGNVQPHSLCVSCHQQQTQGMGMHPLGAMEVALPENLVAAGAHASVEGNQITCTACHRAHGGASDALLVMPDRSGDMCLSCHERLDDTHFGGSAEFSHPLGESLSREQKSAMASLGRPADAGQSVQCLSCHRMHHGLEGDDLLVEPAASSALCVRCHAEQSPVLSGPHNFAASGSISNALNESGRQVGACRVCHSVHRAVGEKMWAATAAPPEDESEACIACHAKGFAGLPPFPALVHGTSREPSGELTDVAGVGCADCHNVHGGAAPPGLIAADPESPRSLCLDCHDVAESIDISLHQSPLLAETPNADNFCGPCHRPHAPLRGQQSPESAPNPMWFAPLGSQPDHHPDRLCTGCHSAETNPGVRFRTHPLVSMQAIPGSTDDSTLPLLSVSEDAEVRGIGCVTCHLPHGHEVAEGIDLAEAKDPLTALRALRPMVRSYQPPNLCSSCHGPEGLRRFLYYHSRHDR